jgi:hypothetical protein
MRREFVPRTNAWLLALQAGSLVTTVAFVVAFWVRPETSLPVLWGLVIPILPLTFLINPLLWRAVCPLATLNLLASTRGGRHQSAAPSQWAGLWAMVALVVLVPARHVAFNTHGDAMIALVVGSAIAAIVLGRRFEARAGFCNAWCPVLPVERLYGTHPILELENPRCLHCSTCTPRGCLDRSGGKVSAHLLGARRHTSAWILTATGLFAIAFPGFVIGYFTIGDATAANVIPVYAHVLADTAISLVVLALLVIMSGASANRALPALGALAAGAYYWYAVPVILRTLNDLSPAAVVIGRTTIALFLSWWLVRALTTSRRDAGNALLQLSRA